MPQPQIPRSIYAGVFLLSAAMIYLQLLYTRILSFLVWHHIAYLVISFSLLGFGASGTAFYFLRRRYERGRRRFLAWAAFGFGASVLAALALLARVRFDPLQAFTERVQFLSVGLIYVYLILPMFFAGLVILGGLRYVPAQTGKVYGANLVGSALGGILLLQSLAGLGGAGAVLAVVAAGWAAAAGFAQGHLRKLAIGGLVLVGLLAPFREHVFDFQAAPSKAQSLVLRNAEPGSAAILTTYWDPLARIDVVGSGIEAGELRVYQDGDAPTTLFAGEQPLRPEHFANFPYYVLDENPDVLAIGIGGGNEIRYALAHQAASVTGVEINASTLRLLQEDYLDYSGQLAENEKVKIIHADGRAYVNTTSNQFDLIQLTGTDTYTALFSGSYVLSESYLYTVEAFETYLDRLNPEGVIAVQRFRFFPPRESLRLINIAAAALANRGAAEPWKHFIAVDQVIFVPLPSDPSQFVQIAYTSILIGQQPFSQEQLDRFTGQLDETGPTSYSLAYLPDKAGPENEFAAFMQALAESRQNIFVDNYSYRIDAIDDDSPFFFNFFRFDPTVENSASFPDEARGYLTAIGRAPIGVYLLYLALVQVVLLSGLVLIAPLGLARAARSGLRGSGIALIYFALIGAGFMFYEIGMMQKLVLLLGHPTYAITVVLAGLLVGSGAGALNATRLSQSRLAWVFLAIAVLMWLSHAAAGWLAQSQVIANRGATTGLVLLILILPAFLMGIPFPHLMARFKTEQTALAAWGYAINASFSVIASVAAIVVAMQFGFAAVIALACGLYLLAGLLTWRRDPLQ